MALPRQENWDELPFSLPGDLPDIRIEPASPALSSGFFTAESPGKSVGAFTQHLLNTHYISGPILDAFACITSLNPYKISSKRQDYIC